MSFLALVSCRQPKKSKEMIKQAMSVYRNTELKDNVRIDSSLQLTNKALQFDDQNFNALNHKEILLIRKRDSKGLIEVADKLFHLTGKPLYLGQKALYLEFDGKPNEARVYYDRAIQKYQEYLKIDTLDFNLMMEYVGILEISGNTLKAKKILSQMKQMDFEEYQIKMIDLYKEQSIPKEQFLKYWKGEIKYD